MWRKATRPASAVLLTKFTKIALCRLWCAETWFGLVEAKVVIHIQNITKVTMLHLLFWCSPVYKKRTWCKAGKSHLHCTKWVYLMAKGAKTFIDYTCVYLQFYVGMTAMKKVY